MWYSAGQAGGRAKNAAKLHQHTAIETMTCGPTVWVSGRLHIAFQLAPRLLGTFSFSLSLSLTLSLYRRSAQVANQKLRW
jgi:hypothetical protein